ARVMGRAGERARRHHQKTLRISDRLKGLELIGCDEALYRRVLAGWLQILADRDEIYARRAHIVHDLEYFIALLAETDHDPRLGEHLRVDFLDGLEQPQGMEISCAGPDP